MGLKVQKKLENKVLIKGTTIELQEVYVRLEFAGRKDGKTLEISVETYIDKETFKAGGSVVVTNIPMGNLTVNLLEDEDQGIERAHFYAAKAIEDAGFTVLIDM